MHVDTPVYDPRHNTPVVIRKDAAATIVRTVDCAQWLDLRGAALSAVDLALESGDVTPGVPTIAGQAVRWSVSAGAAGSVSRLVLRGSTDQGETDVRIGYFEIRNRAAA